jgi:hypothetical protein
VEIVDPRPRVTTNGRVRCLTLSLVGECDCADFLRVTPPPHSEAPTALYAPDSSALSGLHLRRVGLPLYGRWARSPSVSAHTRPTAMANTAWPVEKTSTTSSLEWQT